MGRVSRRWSLGCRFPQTAAWPSDRRPSNQPHRMCGRSRIMSARLDLDLQALLAKAKAQGFLTYQEVSGFLPDEAVGTDRIDEILTALDAIGIELVDGPDAHKRDLAEENTRRDDGDRSFVLNDGMPAGSSD